MTSNGKYSMKTCGICGKEYYGYQSSRFCGAECRKKRAKWLDEIHAERKTELRRAREREKRMAKKALEGRKTITDIANEARQAGMTYGQYVARMGL